MLAMKIETFFFIKKVLCCTETAQESVFEVCYHENEFSEMGLSFLGLVGKIKELL